jgi:hypothetical protein
MGNHAQTNLGGNMYREEEEERTSKAKWSSTRAGRIVIAAIVVVALVLVYSAGSWLSLPWKGKYKDNQIWEIAGPLEQAKLFCVVPTDDNGNPIGQADYSLDPVCPWKRLATTCKWLLTLKVTEVYELQGGKGILEDPVVGGVYVVDLKDSKVNNYVTQPDGMVCTGSAVTYSFGLAQKDQEARMIVAESVDTSSGLPEIVGAVR